MTNTEAETLDDIRVGGPQWKCEECGIQNTNELSCCQECGSGRAIWQGQQPAAAPLSVEQAAEEAKKLIVANIEFEYDPHKAKADFVCDDAVIPQVEAIITRACTAAAEQTKQERQKERDSPITEQDLERLVAIVAREQRYMCMDASGYGYYPCPDLAGILAKWRAARTAAAPQESDA